MGDGDPAVGWETVAERSQWRVAGRVGVKGCGGVNWELRLMSPTGQGEGLPALPCRMMRGTGVADVAVLRFGVNTGGSPIGGR